MASIRCVAVVLAAAVFITGSCVEEAEGSLEKQIFDSIAPLLNESEGQGELGESADPSENTALLTALSEINKKLINAKPQEASGVLNKHFTKELWSKWGDHVKAKELDNDTAEGILNSYLCAKLKKPKMLVAVINWVRGTSKKMRQAEEAEGSEDAKESAKAEDAKKAIQKAKKEDDEKEEAEKVETAEKEKADDEKAEKEDQKELEKEVKKEKKEAKEEKMDAEKDAKDAKKEAKEDAKDAKKEAEEAKKEAKEEAEEAKKEAEEEKKEAKKEVEEVKAKAKEEEQAAAKEEEDEKKAQEEKQKIDEAKAVEDEKHKKKENDLKVQVEEQKQKAEESKDKAKETAKIAAKAVQEKADAEVKKAEEKTEQMKKQKEELEKKLEQAEKKSEETVKKVEEKAAEKVQAATKKAEEKAKENVEAADAKAQEAKKEAKQAKQTAEKKVKEVQTEAQNEVKAEKKAEVKAEKQKEEQVEAKEKAADTAAENAAIKKTEARIAATEKAAVEQADEKDEDPGEGQLQKLTKLEDVAEKKAGAIAKMMLEAKAKVADADEILQHATKMNKFVRRSDQLLDIAKTNEKTIQKEADKLEKATKAADAELKKAEVKRAKAKLAEFKLILSNAVKDAKSVVSTAEQKLKKHQDGLSTTNAALKRFQDNLAKKKEVQTTLAAKLQKVKGANRRTATDLARANAGLKLAQQSEIPEAMRIAEERITKIKAVNHKEVTQMKELAEESKKQDAEVQGLEKKVKEMADLEQTQMKAVDNMKDVELPKLSSQTKSRIKTIEDSMGKKISGILEILNKAKAAAPPKVVDMIKAAAADSKQADPVEAELNHQKEETAKARAQVEQLSSQIQEQKEVMGNMIGPGENKAELAKTASEDVKSASAEEKETDKVVGAAHKLQDEKAQVEEQKKKLQEELTDAPQGSVKEVEILKELKQANTEEKKLTAAEGSMEQAASKDATKLADAASKGLEEEQRNVAVQSSALLAAANTAGSKIEDDKQTIKAATDDKAKDASEAQRIQAKLLETKVLINAAGGGEHANSALKKLEGYQRDFDAIQKEESNLASKITGAKADIAAQHDIVKDKAKQEVALKQEAKSVASRLTAEVQKGKAERDEFASSGALVKAQATAETEKQLRQKVEADASAKVAEAQKEVTELKARLSAASAAAVAVAEDTKAFMTKNQQISAPGDAIQTDQAALQDAEQKSVKLKALSQKATNMLSTAKAELALAQQSNQGDAIKEAEAKVDQYTNDQAKIQQAIQQVDVTKAKKENELSQVQGVNNVLSTEKKEVAEFQSSVLQKWSKVHEIAYQGAREHLNKLQSIQQEASKKLASEEDEVLSKDQQIKKLNNALNLALNPDQEKPLKEEKSKVDQLKDELARSENELTTGMTRQDELNGLITKAGADNDQHSEIMYGAEQQDLKVKLKRSKLHVDALKVALDKAMSDANAEEASEVNAAMVASDAKPPSEDKLKQQLAAEKDKLKQAEAAELDEAKNKLELEKKKLEAEVENPHEKTTEEGKADGVEREAQKVVQASKKTSEKVAEHATKKEEAADTKVNVAEEPAPAL